MEKKTWFITGISSGLGQALAHAVVESGDFAIGTLRRQDQVDAFNRNHQGKAIAILMDVTDESHIKKSVEFIEQSVGKLDVLVNNAGFGIAGAIEETSESDAREIFEANFFGALRLTQSFLPKLRRQRSGHIVQISSHGGLKAYPGFGIYNASKFALEGFSEALALELEPLGIKVTIVEPGPFRTNFAGGSMRFANHIIDDYRATSGVFRERIKEVNGKQEGNPALAAKAIIGLVRSPSPVLRVPLGKIAIASYLSKLASLQHDLERGRTQAESMVFFSREDDGRPLHSKYPT
jgi:NAD(P)-dependent dehydrogenase (short-subunit alcohol dehydrogenase family)